MAKSWKVSTFDLTCEISLNDYDKLKADQESDIDLSNSQIAFTCTLARNMQATEITDLVFDKVTDDFWMATWEKSQARASLASVSVRPTVFRDRLEQEKYESGFDLKISNDDIMKCPDLNKMFQEHYIDRITSRNRFTKQAITIMLKQE